MSVDISKLFEIALWYKRKKNDGRYSVIQNADPDVIHITINFYMDPKVIETVLISNDILYIWYNMSVRNWTLYH